MSFSDLPPAPPPAPGGGHDAPPARPRRPDTVTNAVRLMFAQVVLGVVGLIVLFADKDNYERQVRENTANATQSTVDAAFTVAAVLGIVFAVLYALLAVQVGKGRNWARIVTWVLAGLGILSGLASLGQPQLLANRILGIVGLVIDIALVVLLSVRVSNEYFKRRAPLY